MANRRFIDFPIAATVGNNDIVLIWQDGLNKQTTKATLLQGSPQSLAGLTDVDIAALTNGQILQYNSTTSKWENVDRTDIFLSQLGDVTIVAPSNGQVLVYNSSTSKWENSSGGYVPYTGAVTTVNLGAQSILAGSFVKAGGTAAQFLKANGSVDSTAYGTGSVTSVALTMPTAFSVAGSPITTAGTLAVTATGTTAQYIRGDGSLATFPGLTGFVPYTGATADVNLGTHDLAAERGTFTNNGSSDALTVNQTSGSGYGIIVTKGGNNEALYVSKTSGSGNAMTVVGGRTSLVDLALSSVTNTAGDFLTLSGGVVHKRTAAQTLTDIGGQAALTNPVTGTGTTNYLPKFTGASTIGNSALQEVSGNLGLGVTPSAWSVIQAMQVLNTSWGASPNNLILYQSSNVFYDGAFKYITTGTASQYRMNDSGIFSWLQAPSGTAGGTITFTTSMTLTSGGNLLVGTTTDAGFKLDVNGTGRFSSELNALQLNTRSASGSAALLLKDNSSNNKWEIGHVGNSLYFYNYTTGTNPLVITGSTGAATFTSNLTAKNYSINNGGFRGGIFSYLEVTGSGVDYSPTFFAEGGANQGNIYFCPNGSATKAMTILTSGEVLVGTVTTDVNTQGCQLRPFGLGIFVRSGASTLQLNRLTSDGIIASFRTSDVERGSISIAGSVTSYNVTSDYRLKEDFQEIKGLEKVNAIKVYDYKWKLDNKRMDGVLAHELAEVLPYAVFGEKDELDEYGNNRMQSVDYSKIVPIMIKAIQELNDKIK